MTPKEKSNELVVKFLKHSRAEKNITPIQSAKQCALIEVNDILHLLKKIIEITGSSFVFEQIQYYQEVKQEIELL